jgi:hypothetical protein
MKRAKQATQPSYRMLTLWVGKPCKTFCEGCPVCDGHLAYRTPSTRAAIVATIAREMAEARAEGWYK